MTGAARPEGVIRVAHVIARLNVGGAALHVMLLAAELNRIGEGRWDNTIVSGVISPGEADMRYVADERGLPVHVIPELGREISVRGDLITLIRLWRLFRRMRPQVVHTNTAKAGLVGRLAARLAGVPVVLHTFHGHVFSGYFGPRKTRFFIALERFLARLADVIVTPSDELRRQIAEEFGICSAEKIKVLPIGFDLERFARFDRAASHFRADQAIPADAPLVGIVGRLVPIKNHDLFIRAAAIVHRARPEVWFALIGDGERRAELEALVRDTGIASVTRFTGWAVDTPPVYAALDALVLSSRNEGVPVSIIEAMAARVPVVCTHVGGVPDLIPGPVYGAVVPPDDQESLAVAILDALNPAGHPALDLDAAQQRALETYGIAGVTAAHRDLYLSLLRAKRITV